MARLLSEWRKAPEVACTTLLCGVADIGTNLLMHAVIILNSILYTFVELDVRIYVYMCMTMTMTITMTKLSFEKCSDLYYLWLM